MSRTLRFEPGVHLGKVIQAQEALRKAADLLADAGCPAALAMVKGALRRAGRAVRKKKTRVVDVYDLRD